MSPAATGRETVRTRRIRRRVREAHEFGSAAEWAEVASPSPAADVAEPDAIGLADRVMALELENERLVAELRETRERLRASRARVVEAADGERRRVARDLHDGLQSRLVLLAMSADRMRADATASPTVRAGAEELKVGLDEAITELRGLVQGMMPAALAEAGLCAATEELADRVTIPIELDLHEDGGRPPSAVESTGYFVVAEALANAVKHARARSLAVGIVRVEQSLRIEVADDGVGGAHHNGGRGLRGMADRVEAVGGRLTVESPPGGGTRVRAELPCA